MYAMKNLQMMLTPGGDHGICAVGREWAVYAVYVCQLVFEAGCSEVCFHIAECSEALARWNAPVGKGDIMRDGEGGITPDSSG